MDVRFKGVNVSADDVLEAMRQFNLHYPNPDDYDDWKQKKTYRYAVKQAEKLYPCKQLLSLATGIDASNFSGGEQTHRVFRTLGFEVVKKP